MKATTVKLEAGLLKEVGEVKPPDQTLASYVREAVIRDVRRRKMKKAALAYRALLERDGSERTEMEVWESVDLVAEPKRRRHR